MSLCCPTSSAPTRLCSKRVAEAFTLYAAFVFDPDGWELEAVINGRASWRLPKSNGDVASGGRRNSRQIQAGLASDRANETMMCAYDR